jgi:predicted acetyltransferase
VNFTMVTCTRAERTVLRHLLELYSYDFSEIDGRDLDAHGEYGYRYLHEYFGVPERVAYLFVVDGAWAGFALIQLGPPVDVAEFFVMRKYRRRGVGTMAVAELFERHRGKWRVRQLTANPRATDFWRRAITVPYTESSDGHEVAQEFEVL